MENTLDFYFDFMSPFAYLAYQSLPDICERHQLKLVLNVVDLGGLKRAAGNTGPGNINIPPKIKYLKTDIARWSGRLNVPLEFPASLASEFVNMGFFYSLDRNCANTYMTAAWQAGWGQGGNIGSDEFLEQLAVDMGWSTSDFLNFVHSSEAKRQYQASTQEAVDRGVFGVPIMAVDDELWWGNDRLDFLEEFLANR